MSMEITELFREPTLTNTRIVAALKKVAAERKCSMEEAIVFMLESVLTRNENRAVVSEADCS